MRRAQAAAISDRTRALLLRRPPAALDPLIPPAAIVAVYRELTEEAPASGYARHFYDRGHRIALPWFAGRGAAMAFREWTNPYLGGDGLERGPLGIEQPPADAAQIEPTVLFVPLVGFTAMGSRLGMGAGHYDRWLADHPRATAVGLAWDCQEVEHLPLEPHDRPLDAIVTPTRLFGPFKRSAAA